MKVKTAKKSNQRNSRPFLILPALENNFYLKTSQENLLIEMPKNTGLKLFTKTWPPKRENNKKEDQSRPLTATLEKPTILDISLIGTIDMSTVRKEFLNISNLCRVPLILKTSRKVRNKTSTINRPLSLPLPPPEKVKTKKSRRCETSEDSWEDEESLSIQSARKVKISKPNSKLKTLDTLINKKSSATKINSNNNSDANNNNKTFKIPRKRIVLSTGKILDSNKSELSAKSSSIKLPEPCKTCGRPDQPERFHSHPAMPLKPLKKMEDPPKIPVKSTVQKPVAIKYKSKQNNAARRPSPVRKPSLPSQKLVHTPPNVGATGNTKTVNPQVGENNKPNSGGSSTRVRSAKRTLTCYICGREFGTASLPLHEPKCLQRWERENASLPSHMQRKPPVKPDQSLTQEEWNQFAWESSQSTLIPCTNCGRTFYPDRLVVHQRSCKTPQNPSPQMKSSTESITSTSTLEIPTISNSTPSSPAAQTPPSVKCYICGRMFGTHSIKIHERQCLKKWNAENEALPPDMRSPQPVRKAEERLSKSPSPQVKTSSEENVKEARPSSGKKPPLFPCYICGKLFTVNSIYIHEPQCLKMWKVENDKLPPNKRRPQPLKPDIKFTRDGKIDYGATNEANWQSHLSQLVPCKICARTFNPDRVIVHEKSCKGL